MAESPGSGLVHVNPYGWAGPQNEPAFGAHSPATPTSELATASESRGGSEPSTTASPGPVSAAESVVGTVFASAAATSGATPAASIGATPASAPDAWQPLGSHVQPNALVVHPSGPDAQLPVPSDS
jgi:hypothetical protein